MKDVAHNPQLCGMCKYVRVPVWLNSEITKAIDLDLPYAPIREEIEVIVRRDLCPDCAAAVLEAYDKSNLNEETDDGTNT